MEGNLDPVIEIFPTIFIRIPNSYKTAQYYRISMNCKRKLSTYVVIISIIILIIRGQQIVLKFVILIFNKEHLLDKKYFNTFFTEQTIRG